METLEQKKAHAKNEYYKLRKQWVEIPTDENWIKFCDARILCRHLGVII